MKRDPIKFGTDGWRAVIGDTYTFENLTRVTVATGRWLRHNYGESATVLVGYDTRFLSDRFARHAARVFGAMGIRVTLANQFVPTPAISWGTREYGCSAGVVITASHNPPEYNGFKIKADFGGPASPETIAEVEAELDREEFDNHAPGCDVLVDEGRIAVRDILGDYVGMLQTSLDIDAIREAGLKVAHDAMYGAGQGVIRRLLGDDAVVELHCDHNPGFHGQAPEPIERNLVELAATIRKERCDAGIANDGDADRVGMFDDRGNYVSSHLLLCLLGTYLHEERGLDGGIVKTFSTTHMLDKVAGSNGSAITTTPIGFKYIGPIIAESDILIGGEESGGIAVKGHIPERDGLYIGLLVLEMTVKKGKPLSVLIQELFDRFGPHFTYRIDAHTTNEHKRGILDRLEQEGGLQKIDGHEVIELQTLDGYKHIVPDGWLLVRPSGTEPVLRVYSEAPSEERARQFVEDAVRQLGISLDPA